MEAKELEGTIVLVGRAGLNDVGVTFLGSLGLEIAGEMVAVAASLMQTEVSVHTSHPSIS